MKYYIKSGITGVVDIESGHTYNLGTTYQDYLDGLWVELDQSQLDFLAANPTATHKEVIEMALTPPMPEPTLDSVKTNAVHAVQMDAVGRLNELYPSYEVHLAALGLTDETAAAALLIGYAQAQEAIHAALTTAISEIGDSTDSTEVDTAMTDFRAALNTIQ